MARQRPDTHEPSVRPAHERIHDGRERIMDLFVGAVRAEIPTAENETRIALRDTMPQFLEQLEVQLRQNGGNQPRRLIALTGKAHAEQGVILADYDLKQILLEYQIMRRSIFRVIQEEGPLETRESEMIHDAVDRGIAYASSHYLTITESRFRENEGRIRDAFSHSEKLLSSLRDFKFALDVSSIVAITDRRGVITYVNDKFCEISKYSREELLGKTHRVVNSGHHPRDFFADLWKTISGGKVWEGEIKNRAKDGSHYWVKTVIVPFLGPDARPDQYVAIRTDITKRKIVEDRLERAIRAREDVLAIVSHDLRNPLSSIMMVASLIDRRAAADAVTDFYRLQSQKIRRAGERMNRLIEDLLDVAQMDAGQFKLGTQETCDTSILNDVLDMMQPLADERSIRIILSRGYPDLRLSCDRDELLRVFGNLVGNAIKFTPVGGEIELTVEAGPGGEALFCVKDSGPGIPADEVAHVFDRFWQSERTGKRKLGMGLGLAITKGIIEAHGGCIWVESAPGKGTAFRFTIPSV